MFMTTGRAWPAGLERPQARQSQYDSQDENRGRHGGPEGSRQSEARPACAVALVERLLVPETLVA
jgi:hypothetical protein